MDTHTIDSDTPDEPSERELEAATDDADLPPSDTTVGTGETDQPEPDVGSLGTVEQLPAEDTLEDTGGRDLLDDGLTPPDAPGPLAEETLADTFTGEGLDSRAATEEPEVWDAEQGI